MVTDNAIINAIKTVTSHSILDIGCGEGWLSHRLSDLGYQVTGIDAVPKLIVAAKQQSHNKFYVLPYENIHNNQFTNTFDLAVCNFSLIGKESVEHIFKSLPSILSANGYFIVQTLHPNNEQQSKNTANGWRQGSWQGFNSVFTDPAPWYFRTLKSWKSLFAHNRFNITKIIEPINPNTGNFASIIIIGQLINHHK